VLTAKQLNAGLDDGLNRQRLLNRAVHGYGVVVGLGLAVRDDGMLDLDRGCLELTGGLALDRHGRMLYWKGGRIGIGDLVGRRPDREGEYTLCAHFACRPPLTDGCPPFAGDQAQWWTEGVAFTLRPGCRDVDRSCPEHPAGACVGHDEYLCRRTGALPGRPRSVPVSDDVEWVLRDPGQLCPTGFQRWMYDPDPEVCVPIACLQICDLANHDDDQHPSDTYDERREEAKVQQAGEPAGETEQDHLKRPAPEPDCEPRYGFCRSRPRSCRVRPLVYRNPLLYELANCCDVELPRVSSVSWQDWIDRGWKERVPWPDFERRITATAPTDGFWIRFTRPIEAETIHAASVYLAALTHERDTDYWVSQQVPVRLTLLDERDGVAAGVRLEADRDWLNAEVTGRRSSLFAGARFELTIRGQLLRDECGQMLDARPIDIQGHARCQSRPGGDFVSVFRVGRRRHYQQGPGQDPGYVGQVAEAGDAPTTEDEPR
jgi:hypothetical protein